MQRIPLSAVAVALLLFAGGALAQQRVEIGGTTFALGSSRGEALAVANANFELSPTNQRGHYNLYRKRAPGQRNTPLPQTLGTITIRDGRLVRVVRNLGSFRSTQAEAAVENLISAFAEAPAGGARPSVHTDNSLASNASTSRVYFTYPDRTIQIVIYRPANRASTATIDITEQYALRERRPMLPPAR